MTELLIEWYLWIKALHIISVIAWMAGMLYLPRLFIYHVSAAPGSDKSETFKVMERRLLRAIINPAMIAAFLFGGLLIAAQGGEIWQSPWFHLKGVCILGLAALHAMLARWRKEFFMDQNQHSEKFFRIANEVPTVLMIIIVIMAVVKPF